MGWGLKIKSRFLLIEGQVTDVAIVLDEKK